MATQYRLVSTETMAGLKAAERLKRNGWTIVRSGLLTILFSRRVIKSKRRGKR